MRLFWLICSLYLLLDDVLCDSPSDLWCTCKSSSSISNEWAGTIEANFQVEITNAINGWDLQLKFNQPITQLLIWEAEILSNTETTYTVVNKDYNGVHGPGDLLQMGFQATYSGQKPDAPYVQLSGQPLCECDGGGGDPTTQPPPPSTMPYEYGEVLKKSILFYEAQRSGDLPANNRVDWRGDSALDDGSDVGIDLTGGWYDAGDYVKFGLPMAQTATILAWGLIEYKGAYQATNQLDLMRDSLKWVTDYFVKCHPSPNEFYAQVADGDTDHAYWGRPEEMTMFRPAFKLTTSKPGSDVVGETAAALSAATIVFRDTDAAYADTLLGHARDLYSFADNYRGKYSVSIPEADEFYKSSSYGDELAWAAAWLYYATNDETYLTAAEKHYTDFNLNYVSWAFSWDDKHAGVQLLLYKLTSKDSPYGNIIQQFLDSWLPTGTVPYTPKGLAYRAKWGANRYAANSAFLALVAADLGLKPSVNRDFALSQINYMLGDSGRSYVVGFGKDSPHSPHHASSSCPDLPAPCDWSDFSNPAPNPQLLNGALVGGPDEFDNFVNDRTDYIYNEVTCDYNAGFQSAVAGIYTLHM